MTSKRPYTTPPTNPTAGTRLPATGSLTAYTTTIVAANWLTTLYGPVPVWPGIAATAGTYAAGAALLARDVVQDTAGRRGVLAAITLGAVLSWCLADARLALASAIAFTVAEVADMAVYTPLRRRGWGRAAFTSGVVGAIADSLLFLWLAGFPLGDLLPGQLIGKILWATAVPVLIVTVVTTLARHGREAVTRCP